MTSAEWRRLKAVLAEIAAHIRYVVRSSDRDTQGLRRIGGRAIEQGYLRDCSEPHWVAEALSIMVDTSLRYARNASTATTPGAALPWPLAVHENGGGPAGHPSADE